jgi:hypothetical protein
MGNPKPAPDNPGTSNTIDNLFDQLADTFT